MTFIAYETRILYAWSLAYLLEYTVAANHALFDEVF